MQTPHHRKIELQSPADLSYLYTNTLATSRQKLDLHFPPSANNDTNNDPDPMKERVRELVDEFISKTFTTALPSISINGLDDSTTSNTSDPTTASTLLSHPPTTETIEYEPYDAHLASRVSSLYAQLESLTTTVAQLRRDAPAKAARGVGEGLLGGLEGDLDGLEDDGGEGWEGEGDVRVPTMEGSWEMEGVYEEAVRTLLRLQGDGGVGSEEGEEEEGSSGSRGGGTGLATTVGKVERAGRAAEVVEKM